MTVEELRKKEWIIFEVISGSRAYGTDLPTSDTDIRGVFIQGKDSILRNGYMQQVADEKNDIVFYELRFFLYMVSTNKPNVLELLYTPEDCIIHKDEIFDGILSIREIFLTKLCKYSFGGFAQQQIKKATGYNKKMNWEEGNMTRKGVLDFCYIINGAGTVPLLEYLETLSPDRFGLSKIDHARDMYAMYDLENYSQRKGIVSPRENPNDVQLVPIPKGVNVFRHMIFNKDAYSTHCKRFNEYETWLKKRNPDRFKMNKEHGKNYDSKNMLHTIRLLKTGIEIATTHSIRVRRPKDEIELLMQIRRGEFEYNEILKWSKDLIKEMDEKFKLSTLPDEVKKGRYEELSFLIRQRWYINKEVESKYK